MPMPVLLPPRLPLTPPPEPTAGPVSDRPLPPPYVLPAAAKVIPPGVKPAARWALARTAQILDSDCRLLCTRRGIARQRRELAGHVRRRLPIVEQTQFAGRAREIAGRAGPLLAQYQQSRGLGALIAVVRCAEEIRELTVLTHPEPDVLRAACRPAIAGRAW